MAAWAGPSGAISPYLSSSPRPCTLHVLNTRATFSFLGASRCCFCSWVQHLLSPVLFIPPLPPLPCG